MASAQRSEPQAAAKKAPPFLSGPSKSSPAKAAPTPTPKAPVTSPQFQAQSDSSSELQPDKNGLILFKSGNVTLAYNTKTGTADFIRGGQTVLNAFYSAVKLPTLVTSKDYTSRSAVAMGDEYIITLSGRKAPSMKQHFMLGTNDSFVVWVELEGQKLISNWMAPVVVDTKGGMDLGSYADVRALWVPFDNDRNAKYEAATINKEDTSYEVAAFYDNTSRKGLVIGSVTHDTWKTGISYKGSSNKLDSLQAFGGVSINNSQHYGTMQRDVQQHGSVTGDKLVSPKVFVGYFDDWRNGLEAYGDANHDLVPRLAWNGGVPFGWNSWGAVGSGLTTEKALAASNFIKNNLMNKSFINNNTTYINLDSYWDNGAIDLETFVNSVHKNGQKAGIYWAPFVDWIKDPDRLIEGTHIRYSDAWLKDCLLYTSDAADE
ncbi:MAG: hypothetical protein N2376_01935, partial [Clostridia bacterium]|nr:hypothetical protein [Clostridia bacterium]